LNATRNASSAFKQATVEKENGTFDECISLASSVSRTSPSLITARYLRAQCHISKGEILEAAGDLA
jgi:DnaJ family protein C protein 3